METQLIPEFPPFRGELGFRRVEHVGRPELYMKLLAEAECVLREILARYRRG